MYATDILQEFQAVDLCTYLLHDRIWSVEPIVKFLTWSFRINISTQQPDYVVYSKLARFFTPIGVLLLHSSDLIPMLLNSSPEFN
jgi:hypothetical protein